jgi:RNA-splicing ligase RtcB
MLELKGKYNSAKIFTDNVEEEAINQIKTLLNQEAHAGSVIRIMPDTHAGAGCTIGTTMTITDKVVPYMVGVDIGCGMETVKLKSKHIELQKLDKVIHSHIPAGFSIRDKEHHYVDQLYLDSLECKSGINLERAKLSIGTLGGGNHFIEVDKDSEGNLYLVVHSGSRHLGLQVANYYQDKAVQQRKEAEMNIQKIISDLKEAGRHNEIQAAIKAVPTPKINRALAWLEGDLLEDYLHDMEITQHYALVNRKCIVKEILKNAGLKAEESFTTIHNYIDTKNNILRKGAISAENGERVIIPINMRDGSLICVGKGNTDWNKSAPHGAGRLMSRSKAKETITLTQFKDAMSNVFSSTVGKATIDEAPFAYKPMQEILDNIQETVSVEKIITPIYNFKASDSED